MTVGLLWPERAQILSGTTHTMCPLLAHSGHYDRAHVCPLLDQSGQSRILARAVCLLLTQSGHRRVSRYALPDAHGVSGVVGDH
jgi:hypothetical protein